MHANHQASAAVTVTGNAAAPVAPSCAIKLIRPYPGCWRKPLAHTDWFRRYCLET